MKKRIKLKIIIVLLLLSMILIITGCKDKESEVINNAKISSSEFLLDTHVNITLYGTEDESLFPKIFEEIERLENILSVHVEGSDLDLLKDNAGIKPVKVSEDTIKIIEKSLKYSELTGGLFDVTSGPLIELWGIGSGAEKIPTQDEITEAIRLIDYRKIKIDKDQGTIFLEDKGMIADLGAIAKGYIADRVEEKLYDLGVESAIINLGGNVQLIGDKPDGSLFRIGIQDPDEARGGNIGVYSGKDVTIVSSGDYERYFIKDGVRYHHILNPFTGFPVETEIKSVSIITDESFEADALSTSVLLSGWDKGISMVESLENVEAIFINKDHEVYVTDGLKEDFDFNSDNYELLE
ncbi:MAG: FAD:protein FMN transferase [Bacillota bacterium]|nr:FAD:protein FMN transferase [Bacillota bacterium]